MPPVIVFAGFIGDVAFRETGDADGKIARLADELDELRGEFEAVGRRLKFAAAGRVAAQAQDVFAAERADFFEQCAHLVAHVADAGEMRQRGQPVLPLDAVHYFERLVARGAARAISDGAEIRPGLQQRGDLPFQKIAVTLVGLGREKFEGNNRAIGRDAALRRPVIAAR